MVPVLMQHPPSVATFSIRATRLPSFAPWMAALCPAGPEPITIISKVGMLEESILAGEKRILRYRMQDFGSVVTLTESCLLPELRGGLPVMSLVPHIAMA